MAHFDQVAYRGPTTDKGPSPGIWQHIPRNVLAGRDGVHFFEDFLSFGVGTAVASNVGLYAANSGAWRSYEDTGGAIDMLETEVDGVLKVTTDTTDNDEMWLCPGTAKTVLGKITDGDSGRVAFEVRVRFPQIVTQNLFLGLSEEGCAVADTITDAGVFITTKDMIGFQVVEGASSTMTFSYQKASQTRQVPITALQTLVADTWYKFGFLYTSFGPNTKRIRVFLNGAEQSTYVTATNIAAATFPSGEELNILLGLKNGAGAATRMDIDWVRFAATQNR